MSFLIRHADGRTYELDSADVYREQYMHQGFAIVDPQPRGRERPDLSEKKAAPKAKGWTESAADGKTVTIKTGTKHEPLDD